jgi:hypothetical protein
VTPLYRPAYYDSFVEAKPADEPLELPLGTTTFYVKFFYPEWPAPLQRIGHAGALGHRGARGGGEAPRPPSGLRCL